MLTGKRIDHLVREKYNSGKKLRRGRGGLDQKRTGRAGGKARQNNSRPGREKRRKFGPELGRETFQPEGRGE